MVKNTENTPKILKNGKFYTERDEGCLEAMCSCDKVDGA